MNEKVIASLERAVSESGAPGAVLLVGDRNETHLHVATGLRLRTPRIEPARTDTLYDIASLTKVVATATCVMMLRDEGHFRLEDSIADFVPIPAFKDMSIISLLTHTSGLTAVEPYYEWASSLDEMLLRYAHEGIKDPPGVIHRYSDVGYMLLGKLVELVAGDSLKRFCTDRIFRPLGMRRTAFKPPRRWAGNCAGTEDSAWRGRVMIGQVHDENAYAVGGVSGHAGLFSTSADLARFARALLNGELVKQSTLEEMTRLATVPLYPWQGLGWEMDPWASKKKGFLPSRCAFGHTGWTGTSMWLDGDTGFFTILLSNTCHPSREKMESEWLRRTVHRAIASEFYSTATNSHSGLDRLVRENFAPIEGKRIAVLTNSAAVDQLGRPILDVIAMAQEVTVAMIYSPEHGFRIDAEAGQKVASEGGAVPIVSLYGSRKAPLPDELGEIELFVVDLQDVGSRYYTYMATMRRCLVACARARVPVLILDRLNPIGGVALEGPIATDTSHDVSYAAIPVRHGMTPGELAEYFVADDASLLSLDLTINRLDNWQPPHLFNECSLPWVAPSPNIPTPETALLYVGMCLFEGVNLNEGRGSDTPFAVIGAPWLDAQSIIDSIEEGDYEGCELEATVYTPLSIPGKATHPEYEDEECSGIRIHVRHPKSVRAFTLAVALLKAIRSHHSAEFEWKHSFDVLAGGPDLRRQIEGNDSAQSVIRRYSPALATFDARRPKRYDLAHERDRYLRERDAYWVTGESAL